MLFFVMLMLYRVSHGYLVMDQCVTVYLVA